MLKIPYVNELISVRLAGQRGNESEIEREECL